MKNLKCLLKGRNIAILFIYIHFFAVTIIPMYAKPTAVIWQDNFDDGTLDDWLIVGKHYVTSTDTYTNWNGYASAANGKLSFMAENHWIDWTNNRIMNLTSGWYHKANTFGQWSLDVYPGEDNFVGITFINHFPDPKMPENDVNTRNETLAYELIILNATYEAGKTGAAFLPGGFTSPYGITEEDFTGEPCFIFYKSGEEVTYTIFAIKEIPSELINSDVFHIVFTRDLSSNFKLVVNQNIMFSVIDDNPPSTSLSEEGYFFSIYSWGSGSWVDNISVSDYEVESSTSSQNSTRSLEFLLIVSTVVILVIKRRK